MKKDLGKVGVLFAVLMISLQANAIMIKNVPAGSEINKMVENIPAIYVVEGD